jgi:hypothetical protein
LKRAADVGFGESTTLSGSDIGSWFHLVLISMRATGRKIWSVMCHPPLLTTTRILRRARSSVIVRDVDLSSGALLSTGLGAMTRPNELNVKIPPPA